MNVFRGKDRSVRYHSGFLFVNAIFDEGKCLVAIEVIRYNVKLKES